MEGQQELLARSLGASMGGPAASWRRPHLARPGRHKLAFFELRGCCCSSIEANASLAPRCSHLAANLLALERAAWTPLPGASFAQQTSGYVRHFARANDARLHGDDGSLWRRCHCSPRCAAAPLRAPGGLQAADLRPTGRLRHLATALEWSRPAGQLTKARGARTSVNLHAPLDFNLPPSCPTPTGPPASTSASCSPALSSARPLSALLAPLFLSLSLFLSATKADRKQTGPARRPKVGRAHRPTN